MDPIDRYTFRAPTEEDFDAVVAVLLADQRADDVSPPVGTPGMKTDRVPQSRLPVRSVYS